MRVAPSEMVLECRLAEFWTEFWSQQRGGVWDTLEGAVKTLCGDSRINPRFRIRTPDGKGDIFFNNRELLCRFAGFQTSTQDRFLNAIRQALAQNDVKQIVITVPWSKNGERRIQVRSSEASMNFEVLN